MLPTNRQLALLLAVILFSWACSKSREPSAERSTSHESAAESPPAAQPDRPADPIQAAIEESEDLPPHDALAALHELLLQHPAVTELRIAWIRSFRDAYESGTQWSELRPLLTEAAAVGVSIDQIVRDLALSSLVTNVSFAPGEGHSQASFLVELRTLPAVVGVNAEEVSVSSLGFGQFSIQHAASTVFPEYPGIDATTVDLHPLVTLTLEDGSEVPATLSYTLELPPSEPPAISPQPGTSVAPEGDTISLTGTASPSTRLTIQGELVDIDEDGTFEIPQQVAQGTNVFSIEAQQPYRRPVTVPAEYQVVLPPTSLTITAPDHTPLTVHGDERLRIRGETSRDAVVRLNGNPIRSRRGSFSERVNLAHGRNVFVVEAREEGHSPSSVELTVFMEPTLRQRAEAWCSHCADLRYAELERNPARYSGQTVHYSGRINQILEEGTVTFMLVGVSNHGLDNIAVVIDAFTDFVRDDRVHVYGTIVGPYTYESVAGWTITVPLVDAAYVLNRRRTDGVVDPF